MNVLDNRVALITGASRGIGKAIALELGTHGAAVIGTSTSASGAEGIAAELKAKGIKGAGVVMNVNDETSVDSVIEDAQRRFGDVAILVNNAGITRDNLLLRMKDEEWDEIMATDLKSVYRLSKSVLRAMIKARYGRIINITSVIGLTGNPGQTNYAAAKAGIIGFSKSLAREVGSRNITVNCIAPGFIDTDMTRALPAEVGEALVKQIPLGRLGEPRDVAAAALFLASPGAAYITGCTLHVNGGLYMD
ncbi:MAG TPA: 3-oxoacyl-ACP reductase FabG [Burkholderiales bacterium]|nr:3-oxoacyl-ACP reductase FabG [Burkholderiales bacterium]